VRKKEQKETKRRQAAEKAELGQELAKFGCRVTGRCENTIAGGGKAGQSGNTVNKTLLEGYRIRYYLSSEKLRTVD